jgi:hypothetical protein
MAARAHLHLLHEGLPEPDESPQPEHVLANS